MKHFKIVELKSFKIKFCYWVGNKVFSISEIFEAEDQAAALDQLYKKYRIYILESIKRIN